MTTEAGVLIGSGFTPIFWHLPEDRTVASLPDSRSLWDQFWEHRADVVGFAHSHPGADHWPGPSYEDLTTFAAVERGLGRRLAWWITNETSLVALMWAGPKEYDYEVERVQAEREPPWVVELRNKSKGTKS